MARVCCVETCRAVPQEDITFFNFPIKQSLLKKWKDAIQPTEALTLDSVICSKHFASEDYETIRGRVRLKAKVVPSIFDDGDSPKSSEESQKDPKENGHAASANETDEESNDTNENQEETNENQEETNENQEETNEESNEAQAETKESEAINNNCKDSSRSDDGESDEEQGLEEDGQEEFEMPVELSCEVQLTEGDENETIECVPEAILHEDSDSHSEGDIHKEDIEDIIANYHIKQDPKLAERLKASLEKENVSNNQDKSEKECSKSEKECNKSEKECNKSEKECNKSEKECSKSDKRGLPPDKDNDCVEVSYTPSRKRRKPEYIEIPVDKDSTDKSNDCLMVMENVQVDIDPSMLLFAQDPDDDDDDSDVEETEVTETPGKDSKRKTDPISLLTSSDDDDVIIEEPHIDTVEVSDEDEDDIPLTKLVKPEPAAKVKMTKVAKILWGKTGEYYCVKCRYTTTSHGDYTRHKEQHEKIFNVCEICNFSTASKSQFVRHKRSHKDEKCFKCFKCDYKAKHHVSLIYHLKSHGVMEKEARDSLKVQKNKCQNCKMYFTNYQNEYLNHVRECRNKYLNKCSKCKYTTVRKSDLKRHYSRRHGSDEESDETDEEMEEVGDEE